jgi:hypothetical protein
LGELADSKLPGIAEIDRPDDGARSLHQLDEPGDEIVDIAEGARLRPVAEYRDVAVEKGLDDEGRDHAPVVGMRPRSVCVEDARHLDGQLVLAPIVKEQCLGTALALIVAGPRSDRVDVAPIGFRLRVDAWIAVNFASEACRILILSRLARPSMLIAPMTLVFVVCTGSFW